MPKSAPPVSDDKDAKMRALRAALQEGERSGVPTEFDFDVFISRKRQPATDT